MYSSFLYLTSGMHETELVKSDDAVFKLYCSQAFKSDSAFYTVHYNYVLAICENSRQDTKYWVMPSSSCHEKKPGILFFNFDFGKLQT